MPYPWIKIYSELRHDPKLKRRCTAAERWVWLELLLMANECGTGGSIQLCEGIGYTIAELSAEVGTDQEDVESALDKFKLLKMVEIDDQDVIQVLNFSKRQKRKPADEPERVAERVKRHRDAKAAQDVTPMKHPCNTPETHIEVEVDKKKSRVEAEADVERNDSRGSKIPERDEYGPTNEPGGPAQMTSSELKAVSKLWQDKMGSLCPPKILCYIGPEMRKHDGIHGHSALEWGLTVLEEAIASTTDARGPNEKYMTAIFQNWNQNGWKSPPGKRESKRDEIADKSKKAKATRQEMLAQGVPRAEVDATIVEYYGEGF